jgi:hypothetical protein
MEAIKHMTRSSALVALLLVATSVHAGITSLATSPISGASSVAISPNILFVLDDSASMDWPYLPDWAGDKDGAPLLPLYQKRNPRFNGIAYNPAVNYTPPRYFNADGTPDTTTYPSQTTWTTVKNDGYGVQDDGTVNLVGNAYFFTTVPGEYCTNQSMKTCVEASAKSAEYPVPAYLRWCKSAAAAAAKTPADGDCQATEIDPAGENTPFNFPRMPAPRVSTVTISGTDSTSVTSIKVHDKELLPAPTVASNVPETVAKNVADGINACTFEKALDCGIVGYSAIAAGKTVVISAPGIPDAVEKPAISASGEMTLATVPFAPPSTNEAPGENLLTVITPSTVLPVKDARRSDCETDPCSYEAEMTNYANWWAYYHTRMQAMKTAASLSFQPISSSYRVGYMTINNNATTDFQNIAAFDATNKKAWYDKVFAAVPGKQTPLRVALSNAGRLYAGRLNDLTFNGVTVVDPVQFYCQQNVTILSTDGYWNEGEGFQWNGVTAVGDQDGPGLEVRPQLDAGGPQEQETKSWTEKTLEPTLEQAHLKIVQSQSQDKLVPTRTKTQQTQTAQLQSREKTQWQSQTWQLEISTSSHLQSRTKTQPQTRTTEVQYKTGKLQAKTYNLRKRTKDQDQESTSHLQSASAQLQSNTHRLQQNLTQVQQLTSSDGGTRWTGPSNVDKCTPKAGSVRCSVLAASGWLDVASCTVVKGGVTGSGGEDTKTYTTDSACQYDDGKWENADSCTAVTKPVGPSFTAGTWVEGCRADWPATDTWVDVESCKVTDFTRCRYTAWSSYEDVDSCAEAKQSTAPDYTVEVARRCRAKTWSDWAVATTTCETKAGSVECEYNDKTSDWHNDPTCEESYSTESPFTLLTKKECRINASWEDVPLGSTCTVVSSGATRTDCKYLTPSDWSDTASCTEVLPAGAVYPRKIECQNVWTPFTDTSTCDAVTDKIECLTVGSDFKPAASCKAVSGKTWCQYSLKTDWTNVDGCTESKRSSGPIDYPVGSATECRKDWGEWTNVASCTVSTDVRECQYTEWSDPIDGTSCTALGKSTGPTKYTEGLARKCGDPVWAPWADAESCTPDDSTECGTPKWSDLVDWVSTTACESTATRICIPTPIKDDDVASCDEGTVTADGRTTTCTHRKLPVVTTHVPSGEKCVDADPNEGNGFVRTTCTPKTDGPKDIEAGSSCKKQVASASNDWVTTSCSSVGTLGPTSDTLADVAEYYWKTDLRDPLQDPPKCTGGPIISGATTSFGDVCSNDLKTEYPWQKMNTYTLGLGASGLMQYDRDYESAKSPDFNSIKSGELADPDAGTCSWQSAGECNWPKPAEDSQANIDDLWHAAVNGRGTYFSATDPSSLATGLSDALKSVGIKAGALAAVTVTSPNLVVRRSRKQRSSRCRSLRATGRGKSGQAHHRPGTTGAISATPTWAAQAKLDAKVSTGTHAARKILTFNPDPDSTTKLKSFLWDDEGLSDAERAVFVGLSDADKAYFAKTAIAPPSGTLTQFCSVGTICLPDATQTAASGKNLVNFLRGDKSNEGALVSTTTYYRQRTHLLGDIAGSEAVYVKGSPWNYADYRYGTFKAGNASRTAMVYIGANDGMLHAFNESTGEEAWAYVPALVVPTLYKLADKSYSSLHQFFVDGTPVMGDICASDCATPADGDTASPVWKTILVGGLNHGGRGYYALDITTPASPKALWEFTHDNLGYSYGNPVITKLKNGTWVVIVASGYNNVPDDRRPAGLRRAAPGDPEGRQRRRPADHQQARTRQDRRPAGGFRGDRTIARRR